LPDAYVYFGISVNILILKLNKYPFADEGTGG
jgi:hypothetical protein